jgi:hypothetical protein
MAQIHAKPQFDTERPATDALGITPSDTDDHWARSLYIGGAGNVSIVPFDGTAAVTFMAVPVGVLPVAAQRVRATGTTATNIVGLY